MSITDELREWAGRSIYYKERRDELTAIADRIDAEHAKLWEQVHDAEHEESIAWDRVRSAERRNDKLRELLLEFRNAMWMGGEWTEPFDERMLELGVKI